MTSEILHEEIDDDGNVTGQTVKIHASALPESLAKVKINGLAKLMTQEWGQDELLYVEYGSGGEGGNELYFWIKKPTGPGEFREISYFELDLPVEASITRKMDQFANDLQVALLKERGITQRPTIGAVLVVNGWPDQGNPFRAIDRPLARTGDTREPGAGMSQIGEDRSTQLALFQRGLMDAYVPDRKHTYSIWTTDKDCHPLVEIRSPYQIDWQGQVIPLPDPEDE